jgi:hypothetical protein
MTQATSGYNDRIQNIRKLHIKEQDFYRIGGGLTVIIVLVIIGSWVFGQNQFKLAETMLGYITNVATEALSVVATIIVVDQLSRRRAQEERKVILFEQAKWHYSDMSANALEKVQKAGWWNELLKALSK